jgi:FKBP12-rapamycin complex-associated protein
MISGTLKDRKKMSVKGITISQGPTDQDGEEPTDLNARALEVITRVQSKLTGRDFPLNSLDEEEIEEGLTVEQQVDRLIQEASSVENLCQLFQGWCPLW